MENYVVPLELTGYKEFVGNKKIDELIQAKKNINQIFKDARVIAKPKECLYCGKGVDTFCNSHTIPSFILKNITLDGKLDYINTIIKSPISKDSKGVKEAGTFYLLCRECDSKIFQDYENPANYLNVPSTKMLAQIDMKSNLQMIYKRLVEIELYSKIINNYSMKLTNKLYFARLDLTEYLSSFQRAIKKSRKPFDNDYHIGFYAKLPYKIPIAFQGVISLIFDLENNVINNIYEVDKNYKIMKMNLCLFPLNDYSIVLIFVPKGNNRYGKFFKQLRKLGSLEEKLNVINYIVFSYSEEFFLNRNLPSNILTDLEFAAKKTPDYESSTIFDSSDLLEFVWHVYNFEDRYKIPNILLEEFSIAKS